MCARYSLRASGEELLSLFDLADPVEPFEPRYNVAPTDTMPIVIAEDDVRQVRMMRWGLLPPWTKDVRSGVQMINARSESVFDKVSFRQAAAKRRCLVPADGFYEWQDVVEEPIELGGLFEGELTSKGSKKPRKQPYHIRLAESVFAFAGIFEQHPQFGPSYSILTCPPNSVMAKLHDRMPVLIHPDDYAAWLDGESLERDLRGLLIPAPDAETALAKAHVKVGNVRNDDPSVLVPE